MSAPANVLSTLGSRQSCSRIPHLRSHLLAKKLWTKNGREPFPHLPNSSTPQRHQNTLSAFDNTFFDNERDSETQSYRRSRGWPLIAPRRHAVWDRDAAKVRTEDSIQDALPTTVERVKDSEKDNTTDDVRAIISEGHPERILATLLDPSVGHNFIRGASDEDFTRAFVALDPQYFLEPFKDIYRFVKRGQSEKPTYRWVRSLDERFKTFTTNLDHILSVRRDAGHTLNLDAYRTILNCARSLGDAQIAEEVMNSIMVEDRVVSDLDCYNYIMEAMCWSKAWSKEEQYQMRVTPRNLAIRSWLNRPPGHTGHSVGRSSGLRSRVLGLFEDLVKKGLNGNEETFTNVMVALGREGDIDGVKSILKSVWNVDVDLLHSYDEEEIESPTFYEQGSHLRPTSRLLFTVAHVFGSNNDVEEALRLVDYLARNYNLEIPAKVWTQLCDSSFVLHLPTSKKNIKDTAKESHKASRQVFARIWEAMTDAPYNVELDVPLLMLRATSERKQWRLTETLDAARKAQELLDRQRANLFTISKKLLEEVKAINKQEAFVLGVPPASFFNLRREFLSKSLTLERDLQLLLIEISKIFREDRWPGTRRETRWAWRELPSLVEEFADYMPNVLEYKCQGGHVQIQGKYDRNRALRAKWHDQTRRCAIIRTAVDTDDNVRLVNNLAALPSLLAASEDYCFVCEMKTDHTTDDCPRDPYHNSMLLERPLARRTAQDIAVRRMQRRSNGRGRD